MLSKINGYIKHAKRQYEIIFTDRVSEEFEKECQDAFLKWVDYLYNAFLLFFAFMTVGSLYFFTTRVILQ